MSRGTVRTELNTPLKWATYVAWQDMKARCLRKSQRKYKDYGGRGITISDELLRFEDFVTTIGWKPSFKHSLDRINNNGNYERNNIRWATWSQQQKNKRAKAL